MPDSYISDRKSTLKGFTLFRWLIKMAWRDSRRNWSRLFLFTASIILGIAALVAISSFGDNLRSDIDEQVGSLIGADLVLSTRFAPDSAANVMLDSVSAANPIGKAREVGFNSMAYFERGVRFVDIRALEGPYPFYGDFETVPTSAAQEFRTGRKAILDQTLMLQFEVEPGDSVKIGNVTFEIVGRMDKAPGQSGVAAFVAPVIYIPIEYLEATGLIQRGSRITYRYFYQFEDKSKVKPLKDRLYDRLRAVNINSETLQDRKDGLGQAFTNLTRFLNLVGFLALLLGSIGVASAVHIYLKGKIGTVAILRCLGTSGGQAFSIYLIQIAIMGFIGSLLGAGLGSLIQLILPELLEAFLPLEASRAISPIAILQGILTGVAMAILFALLPLLRIRSISPLTALRASYEGNKSKVDYWRILVFVAIGLFVWGFSYSQTRDIEGAFAFLGVVGGGFLILAGLARLLMWAVRKYFPSSFPYVWRQALANLYRPNNQTLVLIVSIGLGTAMISTLYLVQDLLLAQVDLSRQDQRSNMVLFDIQTNELEGLGELVAEYDMPLINQVPVITARLLSLNGKNKQEIKADTSIRVPDFVFSREYRLTYRDTLTPSEKILEGDWVAEAKLGQGLIPVSIEEDFGRRRMKLAVGDSLTFNIQGSQLKVQVGSFRRVDFARDFASFFFVFPKGVLENAPQFHAIFTRTDTEEQSAKFQQQMVENFPTISVIDLRMILKTLEDIWSKVSFVIKFMAGFSILTGLLVLISSISISKFQRIRESVLLRTLGANQRQILLINAGEYLLLGLLASATGVLISLGSAWALAYFSFEVPFRPNILPILLTILSITSLTVLMGMLNIRGILKRPPLEILRQEV